jgi:hypothetical protein
LPIDFAAMYRVGLVPNLHRPQVQAPIEKERKIAAMVEKLY